LLRAIAREARNNCGRADGMAPMETSAGPAAPREDIFVIFAP
jgi:hypothetical protein